MKSNTIRSTGEREPSLSLPHQKDPTKKALVSNFVAQVMEHSSLSNNKLRGSLSAPSSLGEVVQQQLDHPEEELPEHYIPPEDEEMDNAVQQNYSGEHLVSKQRQIEISIADCIGDSMAPL
jgi:hypothetical protein